MKAYQVLIRLDGVEVWRRVVIPADITFKALHRVIQYSMGWYDSHLYQFELENNLVLVDTKQEKEEYEFYNDPNMPTFGGSKRIFKTYRLSKSVKVDKYLEVGKPIEYVYDMGDHWEHAIILEKVIEDYPNVFPVCLEGAGACPPEDCGGVGGYLDLLDIIEDPEHPMYDEIMEWLDGSEFNNEFDLKETNWWMENDLKLKRAKKIE